MKTYIIHVSDAFEREKHVHNEIKDKTLDAIFINEGDLKDLSPTVLDKYFTGLEMKRRMPTTSCAYKHFLAYQEIIKNNVEIALIFEDDIILSKNFQQEITKIVAEAQSDKHQNFLISLEDSGHRFVKKSERIKNKHFYKRTKMRGTGAYIIDLQATKNIMQEVMTEKCHRPIDCFLETCAELDKINIYWTHPTIVSQGSFLGSMQPLIGYRPIGNLRVQGVKLKRWYKKLLADLK